MLFKKALDTALARFDEIRIPVADPEYAKTASLINHASGETSEPLSCHDDDNDPLLVVCGSGFRYSFDKRSGMPVSMMFEGEELLDRPVEFNFWRAPVDNDMFVVDKLKTERLDHTRTRAYEVKCSCKPDCAEIQVRQSAGAISVQPVVRTDTVWKIYRRGAVTLKVHAVKDPQILSLPRIGIRLFLKKWLKTVTYYGMGPMESYEDKHQAARHDSFTVALGDLHEPYIRPQENGSHYDCDYVSVRGKGLCFHVIPADGNTFSFNASRFTQEELENKAHDHELTTCGSTVLCIDHRMSGMGSASCGPELPKAYRIDKDRYSFAFMMIPENLNRQL